MTSTNGNGIKVPAWLVGVVVAAATVYGVGYAVGQQATGRDAHIDLIDIRLCRIERALNVEPWPTCPGAQQP